MGAGLENCNSKMEVKNLRLLPYMDFLQKTHGKKRGFEKIQKFFLIRPSAGTGV